MVESGRGCERGSRLKGWLNSGVTGIEADWLEETDDSPDFGGKMVRCATKRGCRQMMHSSYSSLFLLVGRKEPCICVGRGCATEVFLPGTPPPVHLLRGETL